MKDAYIIRENTMFDMGNCSKCGKPIRRGDNYGERYYDKETGEQINIVQAYNLHATQVAIKEWHEDCLI